MTDRNDTSATASGTYALYRHFDEARRLLYVGITGDLAVRHSAHISQSRWMQLTASSTVERHDSLKEVLEAERTAIHTERPIFNKKHNDTPEAAERVRTYLEEIGRTDLFPPPRKPWHLWAVPAPAAESAAPASPPQGTIDEPHRGDVHQSLYLSIHIVNPGGSTSVIWRDERHARRVVELCQGRGMPVTLGDEEPRYDNPFA